MDARPQFRSSVGRLIQTIVIPDFGGSNDIHPRDFDTLASYNWLNESVPTIIVPGTKPLIFSVDLTVLGAPGKWTPPRFPMSIPRDIGFTYIDQNASRHPKYPLEPLFRAVFTEQPDFDPSSLDLVTDRNNLRKLIGSIPSDRIENYRIDIELVGKTMLFTRWGEQNSEYITDFRGFGHSFEKRFTTYGNEVSKSSDHHRMIKYNLGGLEVLVRFLVDAYLSDGEPTKTEKPAASNSPTSSSDLEAITTSLQNVRLNGESQNARNANREVTPALRVIRGGYKVPHTSLVELKTRANHRVLQTSDVIHQLWFAQVRHLIVGYHSHGTFLPSRIEQKDFHSTGEFRKFERSNGSELSKLVKVIEGIRTVMVERELRKAVLLFEGGKSLKLHERSGAGNALPADLLAKWE